MSKFSLKRIMLHKTKLMYFISNYIVTDNNITDFIVVIKLESAREYIIWVIRYTRSIK